MSTEPVELARRGGVRRLALLAHTHHEHGLALLGRDLPGDRDRGAGLLELAESEAERMGLAALPRVARGPRG